jgi:hypothetical protein
MRKRLTQKILGIARLPRDLETTLRQQPHYPLAEQNIVLTDNHT